MNDDPRDRELEEAYREASREAPPADLDARILAAAHRAVHARPEDAVRRPSWIDRYRLPLAVAATALIAVTLSLMVEDETRREPEPDAPVAAPRDDAWGSRSAPTRTAPAPALSAPAAPAPAAPAPAASAPAPALERAPAPAEARRAAPPAEAAGPPEVPSAVIRDLQRLETEGGRAASRTAESATGNAAAVPAAPAPAQAPMAAPAAGAPPGAAARERAAQERPSRLTREDAAKAEAPRAPEVWLEEIRRLRAEGRAAEADEALAAFRRAWPDYPLPPDLARP
jgi:hypothetical protein